MRIAFWYQHGQINEIGTGHKFRSRFIGRELTKRGHKVTYIEDDVIINNSDVMVIDHMFPPKSVADRAKSAGMKVVVIDGREPIGDISISALNNDKADYKGIEFMAFPVWPHITKYNPDKKSNTVFVGMGGFDKNNYAEMVLEILDEMGVNAIVANSINHPDFRKKFSRVEIFNEDNYYDAMHECLFAVTNGGLTFFQALHYGMPTIAIHQYEHQITNISSVGHCCLHCQTNKEDMRISIQKMMDDEYYRRSLSTLAQYNIDGKGVERICNIIEGLVPCKQ